MLAEILPPVPEIHEVDNSSLVAGAWGALKKPGIKPGSFVCHRSSVLVKKLPLRECEGHYNQLCATFLRKQLLVGQLRPMMSR